MQKESKCRTDKKQKFTWLNMQKDILKNLKIQNRVRNIQNRLLADQISDIIQNQNLLLQN